MKNVKEIGASSDCESFSPKLAAFYDGNLLGQSNHVKILGLTDFGGIHQLL